MFSANDAAVAVNGGVVTYDASRVALSDLKEFATQVAGLGGRVMILRADLLSNAVRNELSILGFGKVTFVDG